MGKFSIARISRTFTKKKNCQKIVDAATTWRTTRIKTNSHMYSSDHDLGKKNVKEILVNRPNEQHLLLIHTSKVKFVNETHTLIVVQGRMVDRLRRFAIFNHFEII